MSHQGEHNNDMPLLEIQHVQATYLHELPWACTSGFQEAQRLTSPLMLNPNHVTQVPALSAPGTSSTRSSSRRRARWSRWVHFHLINSIMVGKKKTNDVQFYTEARRSLASRACSSRIAE